MTQEKALLKERFDQLLQPWNRETPAYLYHYTRSETLKKIREFPVSVRDAV